MKPHRGQHIVKFLVFAVIAVVLGGAVLMLLWNRLVPPTDAEAIHAGVLKSLRDIKKRAAPAQLYGAPPADSFTFKASSPAAPGRFRRADRCRGLAAVRPRDYHSL